MQFKKMASKFKETQTLAAVSMLAVFYSAILVQFSGLNMNFLTAYQFFIETAFEFTVIIFVLGLITYGLLIRMKFAVYAGLIFHLASFFFFASVILSVSTTGFILAPLLLTVISLISIIYLIAVALQLQ